MNDEFHVNIVLIRLGEKTMSNWTLPVLKHTLAWATTYRTRRLRVAVGRRRACMWFREPSHGWLENVDLKRFLGRRWPRLLPSAGTP
jgi:hypothetical protein